MAVGVSVWRPSSGHIDDRDLEPGDTVEMTDVGGRDSPAGGHCGGRHEPVVGAHVASGRGQSRPQPRVDARHDQIECERGECREYRLDERLTLGAMALGPALCTPCSSSEAVAAAIPTSWSASS